VWGISRRGSRRGREACLVGERFWFNRPYPRRRTRLVLEDDVQSVDDAGNV